MSVEPDLNVPDYGHLGQRCSANQIKSHKLSVKSFVTRLGISTNKEDLDVKQGKMSEQWLIFAVTTSPGLFHYASKLNEFKGAFIEHQVSNRYKSFYYIISYHISRNNQNKVYYGSNHTENAVSIVNVCLMPGMAG